MHSQTPRLPHAETLENEGKAASFYLRIYCNKNDFTGQIKHSSSACALADKGKKQYIPSNGIKIGQTNHTDRIIFQKSECGEFKGKSIRAPQLRNFCFFSP